jgi:DNA-binding MarR family transcriptional regulator
LNEVQTWRRILRILYNARKRERLGAVERSELAHSIGLPVEDVQFHIDYLVEKELIKFLESPLGQKAFQFVRITAKGIDLIADPSEFNSQFPPQVIVQNILGDKLDIEIGDCASNVSVGKDIVHVQIGADAHCLTDVCARFVQDFGDALDLHPAQMTQVEEQVARLEIVLAEQDPDLGEIQRIKQSLAEQEGRPAVRTAFLFSHDAVTQPIRRAIERLIGHPAGGTYDD